MFGVGLLQGYSQRAGEERAKVRDDQKVRDERELAILQHLTTSDRPDIQDAAYAGLLNFSDPRKKKKGLSGFLGETEGHPALGTIRAILGHGDQQQTVEDPGQVAQIPLNQREPQVAAAPQAAGVSGPPPAPTGLAQAPAPATPDGPPAMPQGTLPTFGTQTVPRQPFYTPEERLRRNTVAKSQADTEGDIAGWAPLLGQEGAIKQVQAERMRRTGGAGAGDSSIQGQLPDGTTAFAFVDKVNHAFVYPSGHPNAGQPIPGFVPRTSTGSRSMGMYYEQAAKHFGFPSGAQVPTERVPEVEAMAQSLASAQSGAVASGRGQANAGVPLSTSQRLDAVTKLQTDWYRASQNARDIQGAAAKMATAMQSVDQARLAGADLTTVIPPAAEAMIVTFERALDPNSVVREAEANRPGQFQGLLTRLEGAYDRLKTGGATIPIETLRSYASLAQELAFTASVLSHSQRQRISDTATGFGVDPGLVFGPADQLGVLPGGPPQGPAPAAGASAGAGRTGTPKAGGAPQAGPGPEWEMRGGKLYHNGVPY